ncbi:AraC family transcriptional regulator [Chimaeribacter californicus]|uniref:AraC family transcriptional regulator n=1 Tax=Chimaeribacter californicus TaxID=2060067 RepID=A0A2N5E2Z6_9GAMM|nr:AraC family transcriptional regulator [Chimaeribacter californicus]PLR35062.1 AraC family transcriptional regulator [Chimaeribacter californicus]
MNGKKSLCDVKSETTYNIPLVIHENVISSGITLISLWHTLADESYQVVWPRDKKKPLIENSWVVVYTLQGCGEIILRDRSHITLHGNCVIFLKPTEIQSYYCDGLIWEQYWMEFIPTGAMRIPLSQKAVIYNGEVFNKDLCEVTRLIGLEDSLSDSLAVAFITKLIYQWVYLIVQAGTKEDSLIKIEKLLSQLHTDIQKRWTVDEMAAWMQCSEQYLRRLFMKYTGKSPKAYYLDARLDLALSLLQQGSYSISKVADMLNFFDSFHFSKAFKRKFGYAPSMLKGK